MKALLQIFVLSCLCLSTVKANEDNLYLQIKMDIGKSSIDLNLLNEYIYEETVENNNISTVSGIALKNYGYTNSELEKLIIDKNNFESEIKQISPQKVELPIYPKWDLNYGIQLRKDSDISTESIIASGKFGTKTKESFLSYKYNKSIEFKYIKANELVFLPYKRKPMVYKIKPGKEGQLLELIKKSKFGRGVDFEILDQPTLIQPILSGKNNECNIESFDNLGNKYWTKIISSQIESSSLNQNYSNWPVIAMMDSGLESKYHTFNLWRNSGEKNNRLDDDKNGIYNDYHGADLSNYSNDISDTSTQWHGTHTSGIATGYILNKELTEEKNRSKSKVMVLKIVEDDASKVSLNAISEAYYYTRSKPANIVNLSFEHSRMSDMYKNQLKRNNMILYIAAAGNGINCKGINTDDTPIYPAGYSQVLNNLISVASFNQFSKSISTFSNFGLNSVDVAAPGNLIYSTAGNEQHYTTLSGTSQAAPMVTLLASYLWAVGLNDPKIIKDRIILSSDYIDDNEVNRKVKSMGVINFEKALSLNKDILVLKSGETFFGELLKPSGLSINIFDQRKTIDEIPKIIFDVNSNDVIFYREENTVNLSPKKVVINRPLPTFKLRVLEKGKPVIKEFDGVTIREIIPRIY